MRRQVQQHEKEKSPDLEASPYLNDLLKAPSPETSPIKSLEKGESIFVKEAEAPSNNALSLPQPVFSFAKRERFSASTQDGMWWFV
jgi:hypothetical protein